MAESEAELSTYIVGSHFGFDFHEDSGAYRKSMLDYAKSKGSDREKENLNRDMNNARCLINEISGRLWGLNMASKNKGIINRPGRSPPACRKEKDATIWESRPQQG